MAIRFSEFAKKTENLRKKGTVRRLESHFQISESREEFFASDKYSVGRLVESEGRLWEILDKRSNYVVVCDQSGTVEKKFPTDVVPVNEAAIEFPDGTFKGHKIPEELLGIVESVIDQDPVAVLKCIDLFEAKDFINFETVSLGLGVDQESIDEASSSAQHQAIGIFAGAIGVEVPDKKSPQEKLNLVLKEAKSKNMSSAQKEIFKNMLGLLAKLNLKTEVNEVHNDPDYNDEREILGYQKLKQRLSAHTGIKNYGEQEPDENIELIDTSGNKIEKPIQSKPGHSLGASNDTHRRQLVNKLTSD